jgi:uncharacterized glyoxalase superfamily protein PhnB
MTDQPAMHSLSPHLVCAGAADAIEFYKTAFGATEMARLPTPDGKLAHACLSINGSSVMLVDEFPEHGVRSPKTIGGTAVTIHLIVPDVDAAFDRAIKAGATAMLPVQDMFWGDRYGTLVDPFGHSWSIATPLGQAPKTTNELAEAMQCAMAKGDGCGA